MSETKLYYLGTGTEFIKAQCKEYKTIERALKAAAKDESLVVWDADGNVIGSLTDNDEEQAAATGDTAGGSDAGTSEEETQNPPQDSTQQDDDGQNDAGGTKYAGER